MARIRMKESQRCKGCGLEKTAINRVVMKELKKSPLLFMSEAPNKKDDRKGSPFTGERGEMLDILMDHSATLAGVSKMEYNCSNIVQCRPTDKFQGENREPTKEEVLLCKEHILKFYGKCQPKFVIFVDKVSEKFYKNILKPNSSILDPEFIYETGGIKSPYFFSTVRKLSEIIKELSK